MSDYPDPDEEFELMYGDELDLLREQDNDDENINILPAPKVKRSLDFSSPSKDKSTSQKPTTKNQSTKTNTSFSNTHQVLQNDESLDVIVSDEELAINVQSENISQATSLAHCLGIERSNSKKRTADDLFGDINDIIFDDDFADESSEPKRHKGDDKLKQDLDLIDLIIRKRNEYKTSHNLTSVTIKDGTNFNSDERDKHNLSYQVPKYPFIKIKGFDGNSVYVRFHSEEYEKDETERLMKKNSFQGVLGDNFKQIWNEAQDLLKKEPPADQPAVVEDKQMLHENNQEKQLWVDLYKPRKYLELLSNESTNRTMLRWMKLWDKVVFNRIPKIKVVPAATNDNKKFFNFNELNTKLDEHG